MRSLRRAALALLVLGTAPAAAWQPTGQTWPDSALPIAWRLADGRAPGVTDGSDRAEVLRAFNTWQSVACTKIRVQSPTTIAQAQAAQASDNQNVIFWEPDWTDGSATIGLTQTFGYRGGDIVEADIAFNALHFRWTTGTCDASRTQAYCSRDVTDVFSIALHEQGHFFGLAHTPDQSAIMFASYDGYPKQTLADDDIRGICALYPRPGSGSGPQGAGCTATADCQSGLVCARPVSGSWSVCTKSCTGPSATNCPAEHSCQAATTGYACFFKTDSDLCKPCSGGADCGNGMCINTGEFAVCSRACGAQGGACPAGYSCFVQQQGATSGFCLPDSQVCAANCGATSPCPAGQQCVGGTCRFAAAGEGQACGSAHCGADLVCVGTSSADAVCRRECVPGGAVVCAAGQTCQGLGGGGGACLPGGGGGTTAQVGQACGPDVNANCAAGLVCVGTTQTRGVCRKTCNPSAPACGTGYTCQSMQGTGVCLPSGGGGTGAGQGEACSTPSDCATGFWCVDLEGSRVCVKDCNPNAPACPGGLRCNAWGAGGSAGGYCWGQGGGAAPDVEGRECSSDADCAGAYICIIETPGSAAVCRLDCAEGAECAADRVCTSIGRARVCSPPADDYGSRRVGCPGCTSGTLPSSLLSLGVLVLLGRRRPRR